MRAVITAAASLFLAATLAGQAPALSTISGRVTLTSRVRGTPMPSNVYQPRAVSRHATLAPGAGEIKNVVVYLKDVKYKGALPTSRETIRQEFETFAPRVLVVTRGSTVEFPNADPVFHNVFSLSSASSFDLGRYPKGKTKATTFSKAGLVKVFCHIHSHMSASILVLDHPYFAIPDHDGSFTLPPVPAGTYTVVGWHERVGERTGTVQVGAGQKAMVDLSLPVEDQQ